jgi:hypothetical protein
MAHEITSLIPRGGRFSAVSTACDTRRDRAVAIKVLPVQVTADPGPRHFEPLFLTMIVSLEAIFLTLFVLATQARAGPEGTTRWRR